jgi:hypothetical protein
MVHDVPVRSCYLLMLSCAVVTCTIWASIGERPPPVLHGTDAGIGSRGPPSCTAPSAQLLPFPLRPDLRHHARTPRARAGVRVAAARAQRGLATPAPGRTQGAGRTARRHGAAASPGGGWGGARGRAEGARAARVELSSILRGLTARSRGTPAHLRQSLPPPLPASRLEGGSTSAGVGAQRALVV